MSFFCGTVKIISYCCEVQICYRHSLGKTMFSTKISWDRHFNSRPRDGSTRVPFNCKAYFIRPVLSKRENSGPQKKLLLIAHLISKLPPIECQTWLNSFMLAEISIRTFTKFGASDFCRFCNKNSIWKDEGVILDLILEALSWTGEDNPSYTLLTLRQLNQPNTFCSVYSCFAHQKQTLEPLAEPLGHFLANFIIDSTHPSGRETTQPSRVSFDPTFWGMFTKC